MEDSEITMKELLERGDSLLLGYDEMNAQVDKMLADTELVNQKVIECCKLREKHIEQLVESLQHEQELSLLEDNEEINKAAEDYAMDIAQIKHKIAEQPLYQNMGEIIQIRDRFINCINGIISRQSERVETMEMANVNHAEYISQLKEGDKYFNIWDFSTSEHQVSELIRQSLPESLECNEMLEFVKYLDEDVQHELLQTPSDDAERDKILYYADDLNQRESAGHQRSEDNESSSVQQSQPEDAECDEMLEFNEHSENLEQNELENERTEGGKIEEFADDLEQSEFMENDDSSMQNEDVDLTLDNTSIDFDSCLSTSHFEQYAATESIASDLEEAQQQESEQEYSNN